MVKQRLDTLLAERGLFESRSRAAASVMAGDVLLGEHARRAEKPGEMVASDVLVSVRRQPRYVSRGGIKLENALARTAIDVSGRVALDVGASTGGFTDCLLQRGAAEVIAVDVGYGELAHRLRTDPRVHVLERTNARALTPAMLAERGTVVATGTDWGDTRSARIPKSASAAGTCRPASVAVPNLAVVDVSFISLTKVLPAVLACLAAPYDVLALIKPQFEAPRARVGKGGVVRDAAARRAALVAVGRAAVEIDSPSGLPAVLGFRSSGLPGPKGNRETFIWLAPSGRAGGVRDVEEIERMALVEEPPA